MRFCDIKFFDPHDLSLSTFTIACALVKFTMRARPVAHSIFDAPLGSVIEASERTTSWIIFKPAKLHFARKSHCASRFAGLTGL